MTCAGGQLDRLDAPGFSSFEIGVSCAHQFLILLVELNGLASATHKFVCCRQTVTDSHKNVCVAGIVNLCQMRGPAFGVTFQPEMTN